MATWKAIYWIIPIVVFVILAVYYPGLLDELKSGVSGTVKWVDERTKFGAEEIKADEIPVPKQLVEAYESLAGALERGNQIQRDKCLLTYKDFPEFEGFIISIDFIQEKMVMNLKTDKGVVLTSFRKEIPSLKPCLMSQFPDSGDIRSAQPRVFDQGVVITGKETLVAGGQTYRLADENYFNERVIFLYKTADSAVCFIPTHPRGSSWGCDSDAESIDDDCLAEIKNNLPACSLT